MFGGQTLGNPGYSVELQNPESVPSDSVNALRLVEQARELAAQALLPVTALDHVGAFRPEVPVPVHPGERLRQVRLGLGPRCP